MIYEFITTGDEITFAAISDNVAFACTVMVSQGKASCKRDNNGEELDLEAMMTNVTDPNRVIEGRLEMSLNQFVKENHAEMAKCFHSFAYGTVKDRGQYDEALAETQSAEEASGFKKNHESTNRTSLTAWVTMAWEFGEAIDKQFR